MKVREWKKQLDALPPNAEVLIEHNGTVERALKGIQTVDVQSMGFSPHLKKAVPPAEAKRLGIAVKDYLIIKW